MPTTTNNTLSDTDATQFFLAPDATRQRQYEALRAYFLDNRSAADVAARFGYSTAAFRSLCHQFRHDPTHRASFFQTPRPGPRHAPARDRVRELVVAMRKRNLSVYDIQHELAQAGHTISINALAVLLREEGFARLPRRLDDERPAATRPAIQATADVRACLEPVVGFSAELLARKAELERFLLERVYRHHRVVRMAEKGKTILRNLFAEFVGKPDLLPESYLARWVGAPDRVKWAGPPSVVPVEASLERVVADYLAGMTDRYARQEYVRLFHPDGDL